MTRKVKICGLTTPEAVEAAGDADYIGFVFYPGSPRNVTPETAARLAGLSRLPAVAVTVDPNDTLLGMITDAFAPAFLQLHGNESPERVREIKRRLGLPVIKAIAVAGPADIERARHYEDIADMLMFDARAAELPGGNGVAFDWKMLAGRRFAAPWFLSGGLTAANVEEALRVSGAPMADVSSGVESKPGVKDAARIRAFIEKVKSIK